MENEKLEDKIIKKDSPYVTPTAIVIVGVMLAGVIFYSSQNPVNKTPVQKTQTQIPKQEASNLTTLTSGELSAMLLQKNFFFVNVHVPYEGEIKNTDAFIPYDKIADNFEKLPKDKNAKIVLYCRSGRMSEIAARELTWLGYTQVSHLSGGMIDWEKNGYEIVEKNS